MFHTGQSPTVGPQYVTLAYSGAPIANPQFHEVKKEDDQDTNSVLKTHPLVDGSTTGLAQNWPETASSCKVEKRLKLEMEEFLDLSQFQSPVTPPESVIVPDLFLSNADELNTPVFDMKYPFDYNNAQRTSQNIFGNNRQPIETYNSNSTNIKTQRANLQAATEKPTTMQQPNDSDAVTWDKAPEEALLHMGSTALYYKTPSVVSYHSESNNSIIFSPNDSENGDINKYSTIADYDDDDVANMPVVHNFSDVFLNGIEDSPCVFSNGIGNSPGRDAFPNGIEHSPVSDVFSNGIEDSPSEFLDGYEGFEGEIVVCGQVGTGEIEYEQIVESGQIEVEELGYEPSFQFTAYPPSNIILYDTPEDSNCSSHASASNSPKLKLDIQAANALSTKPDDDIKTSDVITTIDELTSKNFNILDFLEDETNNLLPTINFLSSARPEKTSAPLFALPNTSAGNTPIATTNKPKKPTRSKRNREDDDEDYIPPSKKRLSSSSTVNSNVFATNTFATNNTFSTNNPTTTTSNNLTSSTATSSTSSTSTYIKLEIQEEDSDSDDSCDSSPPVKPSKRRGRPPKTRTASFSSEDYGNLPQSKYRELRDKNNEASRKSRLKRKQKECSYEREANLLEESNRKLRVQVTELDRMLSTLRDNLMTVMLSKK